MTDLNTRPTPPMVERREVWKFPLRIIDEQFVEFPRGARILTVQVQRDVPTIWAEVTYAYDGEARMYHREHRRIVIVGTGHPMPVVPLTYLATVQTHGGSLVWHIYEQA